MPSYQVEQHTVATTRRELSNYMPGLAVSIAARFNFQPGVKFEADLFNAIKDDRSVFPPDVGVMARRMRITRLLDVPVQVDDLVLRLEVDARERMYQKTRRIIAERGVLEQPPEQEPYTQVRNSSARMPTYVDPAIARADPVDPLLARRLDAMEREIAGFRADVWAHIAFINEVLAKEGVPADAAGRVMGVTTLTNSFDLLSKRVAALEGLRHAPVVPNVVASAMSTLPPQPLQQAATPTPPQTPAAAAPPSYTAPAGAEQPPAYPKVPAGPRQPAFNVRDYMFGWNPKRAGKRLARAMVSYRVEELEENYSRICSILGLAPLARGCMVPEEFCFADCEARIARVLPRTAEFERAAGVSDEPCRFPDAYLGPAQTWTELAARSSMGSVPFNRIAAQIRVRAYMHPELDIPIEPLVELDDES